MTRLAALLLGLLLLAACRTDGGKAEPPPDASLPVSVVTFPSQTVLALRHTGSYEGMGETIDRFFGYMQSEGIQPAGELMGVFYDDPAAVKADQCRYEVRMPVAPGTKAKAPFSVLTTGETTTAAVVLVGDYDRIAERYGELYEWIDANGYRVAGPLMEVYLVHPGSGVPPEQYETEVHVPVRPK